MNATLDDESIRFGASRNQSCRLQSVSLSAHSSSQFQRTNLVFQSDTSRGFGFLPKSTTTEATRDSRVERFGEFRISSSAPCLTQNKTNAGRIRIDTSVKRPHLPFVGSTQAIAANETLPGTANDSIRTPQPFRVHSGVLAWPMASTRPQSSRRRSSHPPPRPPTPRIPQQQGIPEAPSTASSSQPPSP